MYNLESIFILLGDGTGSSSEKTEDMFDQVLAYSVRVWVMAIIGLVPPRNSQASERTRDNFIQLASSE